MAESKSSHGPERYDMSGKIRAKRSPVDFQNS